MKNSRNAGRKASLTADQVRALKLRWEAGESVSSLAKECGISRQALYKHLREDGYTPVRIEYCVDGELSTVIEADFRRERIHIINYAAQLSKRAFGFDETPDWDDFLQFLEHECLRKAGAAENGVRFLSENGKCFLLPDVEGEFDGISLQVHATDGTDVPVFHFSKEDMLLYRSDTDGYQLKGLTPDRRYFVKAQAIMAGIKLRDWAVEIIAAGLCRQFAIPYVEQRHCRFVYGREMLDAVYSPNFELDGYTFISFESLLERNRRVTKDDAFIRMDAVSKLKWCAGQLAEIAGLEYDRTEKYMLDLAVLDCLVGNVDRHTRNFGLFYDNDKGRYEVPLVFDSGMGLFEHDHFRDRYKDFDEAMRNVYVSPYGEDPFEMLQLLDQEFHLKNVYPGIEAPDYRDVLTTPFALEYEKRMRETWQKFD